MAFTRESIEFIKYCTGATYAQLAEHMDINAAALRMSVFRDQKIENVSIGFLISMRKAVNKFNGKLSISKNAESITIRFRNNEKTWRFGE